MTPDEIECLLPALMKKRRIMRFQDMCDYRAAQHADSKAWKEIKRAYVPEKKSDDKMKFFSKMGVPLKKV